MKDIDVEYRKFKFPSILLSEESADQQIVTFSRSESKDEALGGSIGKLLLGFSSLEYGVEYEIAQLYDMSNYETGRSVVKYLSAADKFRLLHELHISYLSSVLPAQKDHIRMQLVNLQKMMIEVAELRNIVAHASWSERTTEGFVKTSYKQNIDTGKYNFLFHQLSTQTLESALKHIEYVINSQCHIWEFAIN